MRIPLFISFAFSFTSLYAAGLPFTEDFSTQINMDSTKTNANWTIQEQAVYIARSSERFQYLPDAETNGTNISSAKNSTYSMVFGDVDGDGSEDLITGNLGQKNILYLNDGNGGFLDGTEISTDEDHSYALILGDVDGDGDLDLIAGNYGESNKLYLNNGSGVFGDVIELGSVNYDTYSVVLGDVDADGDLDLIEGNKDQINYYYINDGSGNFSAQGTAIGSESDNTHSVTLGDVNRDGYLDLLVGINGQPNKLYLNKGITSGDWQGFTEIGEGIGFLLKTKAIILADVNGNGNLDLLSGNDTHANILYLNNGFSQDEWLGFSSTAQTIGSEKDATYSIIPGDVDGDGDLDLMVGNYNQFNKLYLNDGSGDFSTTGIIIGSEKNFTNSVIFGDVDRDGDLDVISGNAILQENKLYLNAGGVGFVTTDVGFDADSDYTNSLALGDVDGDGDLDLIEGNYYTPSKLYFNDGSGSLLVADKNISNYVTRSVALADMDGDGDLDILEGNRFSPNELYSNDGKGDFSAIVTNIGTGDDDTRSIIAGDIDGDGDLDIVTGTYEETNKFYLNNGQDGFSTGTDIGSETYLTSSIALGDVDADGDLDLMTGNSNEVNKLYLNNGRNSDGWQGFLETGTLLGSAYNTSSVIFGDVDGDSDLDILTGNSNEANKLYLNNGDGVFSEDSSFSAVVASTSSVKFADVDGDGDLDLMVGNYSGINHLYLNNGFTSNEWQGFAETGIALGSDKEQTASLASGDLDGDGDLELLIGNIFQNNRSYLNHGKGSFSAFATTIGSDEDKSYSIILGDVDGDNHLDMIVGNGAEQTSKYYLGDGAGSFSATGTTIGSKLDSTRSITLGDVDADGDLDLIMGNNSQTNKLYLNNGITSDVWQGFSETDIEIDSHEENTVSVKLADVDSDRDLDLIVVNTGLYDRLYLNDGLVSGEWQGFSTTEITFGSESSASNSVAIGDVNRDGHLDLIVGYQGAINHLYLNNGLSSDGWQGFSTSAIEVGSQGYNSNSIILGDIDKDGDLDLLEGNTNQKNQLYLNNGFDSGDWMDFSATSTSIGLDKNDTMSIILGDVDNDGDLDVLTSNYAQTNKVYHNDGSGGFPAKGSDISSEANNTWTITLGDVDKDGDLDLLTGNLEQTNKFHRHVSYQTHLGTVVSSKVNDTETNLNEIRLTANDVMNNALTRNTRIDYYLSNNGGEQWYKVKSGNTFEFPSVGSDIRWKAELHSLSPVRSPVLYEVVIDINEHPSISGTPETTVLSNAVYSFIPTAEDPRGETLTFSITGKPNWASFNMVTGELSGTPANGDIGVYSDIVISVTDGDKDNQLSSFSIEVLLDTDGDGMIDEWENTYGLNPQVDDAALDGDNDSLSNLEENQFGTNPTLKDTDGDGMEDGFQISEGFDPNDDSDCPSWMCGSSKFWLYKQILNNP